MAHDAPLISTERIKRLADHESDHCLSMFMPTHPAGSDTRQDPIRFRNLLECGKDKLIETGLRRPDATAILESAARLNDDPEFWRHQANGLAVFCSPVMFDVYRLPLTFTEEELHHGRRFHLKPIFPLLTGNGRFFILAISQQEARLLECTRDHHARVPVANMPAGRAELMQYVEREKSLQFHSGTGQTRTGTGERAAVFHGHGGVEDDTKSCIYEYFQQVDRALRTVLHDQRAPLVFAGVESIFPIYRDANSYANLVDTPMHGNPDRMSDAELHKHAWEIVQPHFTTDQSDAAERARAALGTGRATMDPKEIAPLAHDGRIDTLFVACDQSVSGRYDPASRTVHLRESEAQPGDTELLNDCAIQTFLHRGTVYAVESHAMPADSPIIAMLRG